MYASKRCAVCGSYKVKTDYDTSAGYSIAKGVAGTLLLGPIGAVAGINGKRNKTAVYFCPDCGARMSYTMAESTLQRINSYYLGNNRSLLQAERIHYKNLEKALFE